MLGRDGGDLGRIEAKDSVGNPLDHPRNPELYPPRPFLCTHRGPVCRDFSADSFPLPPGYLPRGNNTVFHGRQHDSTFLENRYSVPDY